MQRYIAILICCLFLGISFASNAQGDQVYVDAIKIEGNKRTKAKVILREMTFAIGDSISISDLNRVIEKNKLLILNTAMFNAVQVNIKNWDTATNHLEVHIAVQEAWYIYPVPIFELADRNFNVWWVEQKRSLNRVNFGMRFYHINLTGRRDRLKAAVQFGYTQKYELEYNLPSINKKQTLGLLSNIFFARNKEIAYKTVGNKLEFARNEDDVLLRRFRMGSTLTYRPAIKNFHSLKLEFQRNSITDFVKNELNSEYFLDEAIQQRLFFLRYEFFYENRNVIPYPTKGNFLSLVAEKEGLGIFKERNELYLTANYGQYFPLSEKWSLGMVAKGRIALIRNRQPYNNFWALGYLEDYLRGYEFYVIDGLDYAYLKSTLRFRLLKKDINFGKYMPISQFRLMPFKVYLTLHNDLAYVNDDQYSNINPLGNTFLRSVGAGIDFVLFFDKVFHIEYSMNHLKEKGVFLHYQLSL